MDKPMAKARAENPAVTPKLSEGEAKFFESQGESDIPAEPATSQPEAPAAVSPDPSSQPQAASPEPEEEEIHVDDQGKAVKPPKGFVPNVALREEREARRKAEARAAEQERNYATLQARLDTLQQIAQAQTQPKAEPQQIPDETTDPVGHFRARTLALEEQLKQLSQAQQQQIQQSNLQTNVQRLTQIATSQEAEFAKANPDYNEAANYVRTMRDAQLTALGVADPAARQQALQHEALNIAAAALQQNRNPAQVIFEVAKATGWKPAPKESPPNGAAQKPTPAQQVAMAAAGQIAGQSLGQVNGGASAPTTLESLLKMSDKAFAEATKGDKWRELLGN